MEQSNNKTKILIYDKTTIVFKWETFKIHQSICGKLERSDGTSQ